jgi:16S rRNA (uracil1498-N3)-methyltransferase
LSSALFLVDSLPAGQTYRLDGPEGHHAADVQRLRPGETLLLGDGKGGTASAVVTAAGRGVLELRITGRWYADKPAPALVVLQALAKGDRGELAVQAMTEVGVDEIVPWAAARSVVEWRGERGGKALRRWEATAREAAKQSRRAWVPVLAPVVSTVEACHRMSASTLVLDGRATHRLSTVELPSAGEILVVVGPEGGIADEELAAFVAAGARQVRLGSTVLRTSTAGTAALAVLSARLGRW